MQDLENEPPVPGLPVDLEERRGPRFTLLIRTAKLIVDDCQYLCVVRDISTTGTSIKIFHPLPEGSNIAIEFPNEQRYTVELVWQRDGEAGFQFHRPIDVEDIIMGRNDFPKRDLRFAINLSAQIDGGGQAIPAILANVSRQGARLQCGTIFAIGQLLRIKAPGLQEVEARICWRREGTYGVVLDTTFSLGRLATLLRNLHSRKVIATPTDRNKLAQHSRVGPQNPV